MERDEELWQWLQRPLGWWILCKWKCGAVSVTAHFLLADPATTLTAFSPFSPDQGSFIIEDTAFGEGARLEANHHCNVGVTGVLCMPQYVFHDVHWKNTASGKWVNFQSMNFQGHTANQVHGGIFALSPPNAQVIMDGGSLPNNFFPPGFVSLVSNQFTYLLSLPGEPCVLSPGNRYDGGIMCRVPLRSLKVYSQGQVSGSAPAMQFEVWYNRTESGPADSSQAIGFHQIGGDGATAKQGYSVPVIPGAEHHYRLSLLDGTGNIPSTWVRFIQISCTSIGRVNMRANDSL